MKASRRPDSSHERGENHQDRQVWTMLDELPIYQIESAVLNAAVPIILIIIAALVALRFSRPLITKILRRVLQSQTLSASAERQTVADIQKRVNTIETFG